jgi:uncharacterized protein YhfF
MAAERVGLVRLRFDSSVKERRGLTALFLAHSNAAAASGRTEMERTPAIREFWGAYRAAAGLTHDRYAVVRLGDSPELAIELIELTLAGTKRATACLAREFAQTGEPLPQPGDYVVVVDGAHDPRCVWRTTEVTIKPLIEVDDAFAWDEGEGDRSRDSWLDNHRACFARQASREGFAMHDQIETVFERFTIVWPSDAADRT